MKPLFTKDIYLHFVGSKESAYSLEVLDERHFDYQVVKTAFFNTLGGNMHPYDPNKKLNVERICRVLQNSPTRNPEDMYNGALLLFHGTKRNRVHGILREGFKSSAGGRYGPGAKYTTFK